MSEVQIHRLLRLYPASWRDRYGDELANLIMESTGGRVKWRTRLDVAVNAGRERLLASGLSRNGAPARRAAGGLALALGAWWLFVLGIISLLKLSEHWSAAIQAHRRAAPNAAFDIVVTAASAAVLIVLAGVAVALPGFVSFLRSGGWRSIRRAVTSAAALSALAAAGVAGLAAWAHGLSAQQRNGHDVGYALAFLAVAALGAAALLAWTVAGVTTTRRLRLSDTVLRIESRLLWGLALAMGAVVVAAGTWWAGRAVSWPPTAAATPDVSAASPYAPSMIIAGVAVLIATLGTGFAAGHAVRALGPGGAEGSA